jgi:DNA-binding transcriptional MerR regulator
MLTIGAFAQLGGVSVRTLRHYEELGILVPHETDPDTGYRYYRAEQVARLHRIQALKDLGLTLRQLEPLLEDDLSAEQLSGMLALKQAQLAERVATDRGRLARVERRLRYIEMEDNMSIDMVIKPIPALRVAEIRYPGEGLRFEQVRAWSDPARETLAAALRSASVTPTGNAFLHFDQRPDGTLTPCVVAAIGDQPFTDTDVVKVRVLPAIDAVVTVYRGAGVQELVGPMYGQMIRYADDHGYDSRGPGRTHLISREGEEVVSELQMPVVAREGTPSNP